MKSISILGCGWLGLPLAKSLLQDGFLIKGSTTSNNKMSILENLGITPFLISLYEDKIDGNIEGLLEKSAILIIDIPPKLRGDFKENFVAKIQNLIPFVEKSDIKKVLFVSSTSVYSDAISIVNATTIPNPDTESGKQLLEVEKLLKTNQKFKSTLVRFGGLIGEDRNPIKFLSGKKNIENPYSPINFIHKTDCIGIIKKIIETDIWNETFNAVTPYHPTRKKYYTQKAIEFGLEIPEFNEANIATGKIILSEKIEAVLGYEFKQTTL